MEQLYAMLTNKLRDKVIALEKPPQPAAAAPRKRKLKECTLLASAVKRFVKMHSELIQLKIDPKTPASEPPAPFFSPAEFDLQSQEDDAPLLPECYSVPRHASELGVLTALSCFPERDYNALLGRHETEVLLEEYANS